VNAGKVVGIKTTKGIFRDICKRFNTYLGIKKILRKMDVERMAVTPVDHSL